MLARKSSDRAEQIGHPKNKRKINRKLFTINVESKLPSAIKKPNERKLPI